MKTLEPFLVGVAFLGGVALLAVMASTIFGGCNSGSEIPIDPIPTCVELVTDDCVDEVVDEFCSPCNERQEFLRGWHIGFRAGVESVVCETTDPVCEDDIDEDCEDDTHKAVHKNCRGEGHHKAVD